MSSAPEGFNSHFPFFDARLYKILSMRLDGKNQDYNYYPHYSYVSKENPSQDEIDSAKTFTYASDFFQSPADIQRQIEDLTVNGVKKDDPQIKLLEEQKETVKEQNNRYRNSYTGHRALIHPYAIIKLAGASGSLTTSTRNLVYDKAENRRFYEIDGDEVGGYAKAPTTTTLIKWGNESYRGTQPYSFTDFVFCKWWNKIENNRLITLRRYARPVTDHIEFPDYDTNEKASNDYGELVIKDDSGNVIKTIKGSTSTNPWIPMATAVTYFGEETGNDLSNILQFSAKYNWDKIGEDNKNPHEISAAQSDAGGLLTGEGTLIPGVGKGLAFASKMLGFLGDVQNGKTTNMLAGTSAPPDPYNNGPYENRILGPVNVIMDTYKRKRGLSFTQDGLKIKFEYVSRPISGINNKAIMLDLLSNILLLTYSSGTWFGGMWKYRCEKPTMYPFKFGDAMHSLYQGNLFGKDGAVNKITNTPLGTAGDGLAIALPDIASAIGGMFSSVVDSITDMFKKDKPKKEEDGKEKKSMKSILETFMSSKTGDAIQKHIAARALRGATVPYITGQRALLSGDPVGDWHLTVGNPLNPIVTIGNLIVENTEITFSKELGPDDFPIGFEATVTLKHGLGRDRDAIESMFNRGYGRIYTLSEKFRSSADGETKVDENTGNNTKEGRTDNSNDRVNAANVLFSNSYDLILKIQQTELRNKGSLYDGKTGEIQSLRSSRYDKETRMVVPRYFVNPWQMANIM